MLIGIWKVPVRSGEELIIPRLPFPDLWLSPGLPLSEAVACGEPLMQTALCGRNSHLQAHCAGNGLPPQRWTHMEMCAFSWRHSRLPPRGPRAPVSTGLPFQVPALPLCTSIAFFPRAWQWQGFPWRMSLKDMSTQTGWLNQNDWLLKAEKKLDTIRSNSCVFLSISQTHNRLHTLSQSSIETHHGRGVSTTASCRHWITSSPAALQQQRQAPSLQLFSPLGRTCIHITCGCWRRSDNKQSARLTSDQTGRLEAKTPWKTQESSLLHYCMQPVTLSCSCRTCPARADWWSFSGDERKEDWAGRREMKLLLSAYREHSSGGFFKMCKRNTGHKYVTKIILGCEEFT